MRTLVLDDPTTVKCPARGGCTERLRRECDCSTSWGHATGPSSAKRAWSRRTCRRRASCAADSAAFAFVPSPRKTSSSTASRGFREPHRHDPRDALTLFSTLDRFGPSSLSIVIHGETGTGKERVARAIHDASPRRQNPFLAINCAAMPDALLEDELFGHRKGAFTGADRERSGLLVEADGGTLFFDEVGEMSPAMQAKLLRVLENGEVRPMGSERTRKVDVRTLFATHADLGEAVNAKRFREDLYFRIAPVTVEIPPLRHRLEDLPLLLEDILEDLGRPDVTIDDASMAVLLARSWPGNVRELRSFIKVALVGSPTGILRLHEARPSLAAREPLAFESMSYDEAKREFRRRYYTGLYALCRGNLTQMAKRSGLQRLTVREALREVQIYGLAASDETTGPESAVRPGRSRGPW